MARNYTKTRKEEDVRDSRKGRKNVPSKKDGGRTKSRSNSTKREVDVDSTSDMNKVGLSSRDRDNNPNWYFLDANVAEQVSQLSMRNFSGKDITGRSFAGGGYTIDAPAIYGVLLNPGAGANARPSALRQSGINMSGYRMYTKLAAFTGRALSYQPQNISFMILAMGEVISMTEFIRRALGVAYTYNQRNRAYPRQVLRAMGVNADDLSRNYALHRNRFNQLITRMNQIPIPKSVAYFDKCASLYEKLYLDTDSPMAQTIVTKPYSTWVLSEGTTTVLTTRVVTNGITSLSDYMDILELQINALLQSSTLNVVYADILNYYNKMGGEVWLFDYFQDGYQVLPEYNLNFLLQLHNATTVGIPVITTLTNTTDSQGNPFVLTPNNDVYEDASNNAVLYSPGFKKHPNYQLPKDLIVDFPVPNPTTEDRIECTRFTAIHSDETYVDSGYTYHIDTCLPDHYVVSIAYYKNDTSGTSIEVSLGSVMNDTDWRYFMHFTNWDWCPIFYSNDAAGTDTGEVIMGDLNFYTTIGYEYLEPINNFVSLGLYELR